MQLASPRHPGVLLLSRGRFSSPPPRPRPRNGTPRVCVFRSPTPFSACSQHTAHRKPGLCVVCLPAINAFQRHSTQHLLHCRSPSSPILLLQEVPFSCVQRTGCSVCGLGYPHQVWWAPSMYIARAWSRWAPSPVPNQMPPLHWPDPSFHPDPPPCTMSLCVAAFFAQTVWVLRSAGVPALVLQSAGSGTGSRSLQDRDRWQMVSGIWYKML
jgi:hypothetical protein